MFRDLLAGEGPALVDEVARRRVERFIARQSREDVLQLSFLRLERRFLLTQRRDLRSERIGHLQLVR